MSSDSRHVGVPERDRHALSADDIRAELLAIGSNCEYQTDYVATREAESTRYRKTGDQRFICSCGFDIDWSPTEQVTETSLAHLAAEHPDWDWGGAG